MNKLQIKLIALDLDGTSLQNVHKTVSPRMECTLKAAVSAGIVVVPASGRPYRYLPPGIASIRGIDYLVASNGAVVYSRKQDCPVCAKYIAEADVLWLLKNLPDSCPAEIWRDGKIYIQSFRSEMSGPIRPAHAAALRQLAAEVGNLCIFLQSNPGHIEKVNLPYLPPAIFPKLWDTLASYGKYTLLKAGTGIEVMAPGVTKASGLRMLCEYLSKSGFPVLQSEILAVGDSANDIEMLRDCGIGIAMGNGEEAAKHAADKITLPNTEDGAALAIEKYALGKC